jgi:DNA-3-methyladenine glycosylase II
MIYCEASEWRRAKGKGGGVKTFDYGDDEIRYLKDKDKILGQAIERIGIIRREVNPELFPALVQSIVGQQISSKAQITVWNRMQCEHGTISPETLAASTVDRLQKCGITFKKAGYILDIAKKVVDGSFDIAALNDMSDADVSAALTKLNGIGIWTAEMLMLFSLRRANILSFGDLAIHRGLRMLYHHQNISKTLFEKYRRRYSPCCSVASLYLWAIAGGAIPEMKDYCIKTVKQK